MTLKRADIERFESQIYSASHCLQMAMVVNLSQNVLRLQKSKEKINCNLIQNQHDLFVPGHLNQKYKLLPSTSINKAASQTPDDSLILGRTKGFNLIETQKPYSAELRLVQSNYHKALIGVIHYCKLSIRYARAGLRTSESWNYSETIIIRLLPSLSRRCYEMRYSSLFGSVSRSLRTYPILDLDSPILTMCHLNDMIGLRLAFSSGSASPFAVDRMGRSLLCVCIFQLQADQLIDS